MPIKKDTLQFLTKLRDNNNRPWFDANKPTFKAHEKDVKAFFQEVQDKLNETDLIEGHHVYRIYRDVRFSHDKTPFKSRFAGGFTRATAALRGGYYLNIEPGQSIAGGGFYDPSPEDLKRIRQEFEFDDKPMRKILADKTFIKYFGALEGDEVKTAPKGFDKEHPAIDLIRKKQFFAIRRFTDAEVTSPNFLEEVNKTYLVMRPYFDYMSEVLTTDTNGVSKL